VQSAAQALEALQLAIELQQLLVDQSGQGNRALVQQGSDVGQRQAKATQCLYVMQALDVLAVVEPITGIGACGRFEQIKVVVVMQRPDGHAGALGQFAYLEQH